MMPPSITKYGSPVRLDAQIVALRPHCARTALKAPPEGKQYANPQDFIEEQAEDTTTWQVKQSRHQRFLHPSEPNPQVTVQTCKQCHKYWPLDTETAAWCIRHTLQTPKPCHQCRKRRRQKTSESSTRTASAARIIEYPHSEPKPWPMQEQVKPAHPAPATDDSLDSDSSCMLTTPATETQVLIVLCVTQNQPSSVMCTAPTAPPCMTHLCNRRA